MRFRLRQNPDGRSCNLLGDQDSHYTVVMDLARLKQIVEEISQEERLFLAAYLHHRLRASDPAYRADLEERMRQIESGNKVSLEEAWRLHRALEAEGL